jgi:hypothetical protein
MAKFIHVVLKLPTSIYKLLAHGKELLEALNGNPQFSNLPPAYAALGKRIGDLQKAIDQGTAAERRAAAEALRETLRQLAGYVQSVAEGQSGTPDLLAIQALVESAGMHLRIVRPPPKLVFAAKHGAVSGSVDLTAPASPKRDPHEWQMSEDQLTWTSLPTTQQARTQVTGLPVGVVRYFRHRIITKDGPGAWSDPTVMLVVR